ncbi:MAG TPA: glycosyltransferase family 4 protein [Candidatus Limnocylindrales bacterium]|nr:glycosyltransferase family 4 protein [Candidatus Limnocylindrales bacterium]
MRILIAIGVPRQQEAGAAAVALNQARELGKRGHWVETWFLEDVLGQPGRGGRFEALQFAVGVAQRIRREKKNYDVVNLHAPWGCAYGVWRRMLQPAGAPPYAFTLQGSEERYVEAMSEEDRKGRAWNFGWKNRLWHRAYHQTMYDFSILTADAGAAANREAAEVVRRKYQRDAEKFVYVPNGTEERFFASREYRANSPTRLLYVGTWLDRKGVYYLVDAFELLAKKIPDVQLTVAGSLGPEEDVKRFVSEDVRGRVNVLPLVKREKMPELYAEHDIFVFPSLMEGMPLALLEAMAAGMPVVTTRTCGMADVVDDNVNGLLVPPADGEALAEATERLCRSEELRKRLGEAGQRTMRDYTWERVTEQLERVLERAARDGGAGIGRSGER